MTVRKTEDPKPDDALSCEAIEHIIVPRVRDLSGFQVRRALPSAARQMVGPFIFLDHVGPSDLMIGGEGVDVRPHPHIGLATVTYLFEGEIFHRDSLGTAIAIRPGEVNLMTAGRGIVHSERETREARATSRRLHGMQAWVALPKNNEDDAPSFAHLGSGELPRIEGEGKRVRVLMGSLYGVTSPAAFPHPTLCAEAVLAAGAVLPLDADYDERAIYVASGEIDIAGDTFEAGRLLVFRPGDRISVLALSNARLMLLGGEAMDGERHIWWNFVASSKDRMEAAKADWKAGRFAQVPGDTEEFIALPEA